MMRAKSRKRWLDRAWSALLVIVVLSVCGTFFGGIIWMQTSGCEGDRDEAYRVVDGAGYSKIEIGGARGYRCGRDDNRSNTFSAIGPNGRYVEGVVCCSFMGCAKGCTLRFE